MRKNFKKTIAMILAVSALTAAFAAFAENEGDILTYNASGITEEAAEAPTYEPTCEPTEEPAPTEEVTAAELPEITEQPTETIIPESTEEPDETITSEIMTLSETSLFSSDISLYSAATSGSCGTGVQWEYINGILYIELKDGYKTGKMSNYSQTANIPWNANGWSENISDVYIGPGITHIGTNVFSTLDNLISVDIDESAGTSVETIGKGAFSGCENLININLPETLKTIGAYAFEGCESLGNISFPETLTSIGEKAFVNCYSLNNNLQIPSSVTTIASNAFLESQYRYLTDIYVNNYEGSISGAPWGFSGTVHWLQSIEIAPVSEQYYTGEPIEPEITVSKTDINTGETKILTKGTDYTVAYSNNTDPGTATATVSYIGDYSKYSGNAKSVTFTISKPNISNAAVSAISDYAYTGSAVTPNPTVTLNGNTLYLDTDYTLSYENNVNAGTAAVIITGKGNITGTVKKTFNITARKISDVYIGTISAYTYTGSACTPEPALTYNGVTLTKGTDYTLSYSNNTNAGTATITITGKGNFTGTTTKTFTISARNISAAAISSISKQAYTGRQVTPNPTITYNGMTLIKDTDYTLSYSDNISVGSASIVITGKGNYKSSKSTSFLIYSTSNGTVEGPSDVRYNWGALPWSNMQDSILLTAPDGTEFVGEEEIGVSTYLSDDAYFSDDDEYFWGTVDDVRNIGADAGKYILWVVESFNTDNINTAHGFSASYASSKNLVIWSAKILPITFTQGMMNAAYMITDIGEKGLGTNGDEWLPSVTYTGNEITPKITEMGFSNTSYSTSDFIISYKNNVNVGTASIVFDATGVNVEGSAEVYFNIEPANINSVSVSSVPAQTYTGSACTSEPVLKYNGKILTKGVDYQITGGSNNINVTEEAELHIKGIGNFTGTRTLAFTISQANISGASARVNASESELQYMGAPVTPDIIVKYSGKTLTKGKDYTVSYSNNNAVGTAKAKITGTGNYTGTMAVEFEIGKYNPRNEIEPIDMSKVNVSLSGTFVYNGEEHTPKPVVTYNVTDDYVYTLVEGTDYTISYENNINAGRATIVLTGIQQGDGGFTGINNKTTFNILPCALSATTIADIPSYEYCKEDICPEPEITIGDTVMAKDVDYTLEYANNRNRGTATVTITGKGNLTGTVTKTFEITPRDGSRFTYYIIWF